MWFNLDASTIAFVYAGLENRELPTDDGLLRQTAFNGLVYEAFGKLKLVT